MKLTSIEKNMLLQHYISTNGNWDCCNKYIKRMRSYKYLGVWDKKYPKKLKDTYKPPCILFYDGAMSLLNKKSISLCGGKIEELFLKEYFEKNKDSKCVMIWSIYDKKKINIILKYHPKNNIFVLENISNIKAIDYKNNLVISEIMGAKTMNKDRPIFQDIARISIGISKHVIIMDSISMIEKEYCKPRDIFCWDYNKGQIWEGK